MVHQRTLRAVAPRPAEALVCGVNVTSSGRGRAATSRRQSLRFPLLVSEVVDAWGISRDCLGEGSAIASVLKRLEGIVSATGRAGEEAAVEGERWHVLHALSAAAEQDLTPGETRSLGSVYTPRHITQRVVREAHELWMAQNEGAGVPVMEDPACGAGAFLISAVHFLSEHYQLPACEVVATAVRGADVSARAVEDSRALMELLLWSEGAGESAAAMARQCVRQADFLMDTPCGQRDERGATDIFVGNPPYVKLQNIEEAARRRYEELFPRFTHGSYSTTMLFIAQFLARVAEGGIVGIITQNNFFTSLAAKPLREHMQQTQSLHRAVDYGHRSVFAGASAYTCLLYFSPAPCAKPEYAYETDVMAPRSRRIEVVDAEALDARKWRLAYPEDLANLRRIESTGTTLGDVCRIRVGFATLKDKVFFVEDRQAEGWGIVGTAPDGEVFAVEPAITVPAIRIADFQGQEEFASNRRRILFPYRKRQGTFEAMDWAVLARDFPGAAGYLLACRALLETRAKGKIPSDRWYHWGRIQCMEAPGPKLLTKTFNAAPTFMLDPTDSLFCNGYGLSACTGPSASGWTLKALQRVLNSEVMHYYACLTSFSIAGGYQCYQKNFIAGFGLPPVTGEEASALEQATEESILALYRERVGLDASAVSRALARYAEGT